MSARGAIPEFSVYLFDVDGTLVDSAADICGAVRAVLAETSRPDVPFEILRGYIGRHLMEMFQELFPDQSLDYCNELIVKYRSTYLARQHSSTHVFPGVKETLAALPGLKATATTKGTPTTRAVLDMFGLLPYFDHVQGTDGFPHKPAPDVLLKSLEHFGAGPGDALFVGDSAADMEAGRRAGVKTCAVRYGYGIMDEMARFEPDYWIGNIAELLPAARRIHGLHLPADCGNDRPFPAQSDAHLR